MTCAPPPAPRADSTAAGGREQERGSARAVVEREACMENNIFLLKYTMQGEKYHII